MDIVDAIILGLFTLVPCSGFWFCQKPPNDVSIYHMEISRILQIITCRMLDAFSGYFNKNAGGVKNHTVAQA